MKQKLYFIFLVLDLMPRIFHASSYSVCKKVAICFADQLFLTYFHKIKVSRVLQEKCRPTFSLNGLLQRWGGGRGTCRCSGDNHRPSPGQRGKKYNVRLFVNFYWEVICTLVYHFDHELFCKCIFYKQRIISKNQVSICTNRDIVHITHSLKTRF